jgi:hypothetical protein
MKLNMCSMKHDYKWDRLVFYYKTCSDCPFVRVINFQVTTRSYSSRYMSCRWKSVKCLRTFYFSTGITILLLQCGIFENLKQLNIKFCSSTRVDRGTVGENRLLGKKNIFIKATLAQRFSFRFPVGSNCWHVRWMQLSHAINDFSIAKTSVDYLQYWLWCTLL